MVVIKYYKLVLDVMVVTWLCFLGECLRPDFSSHFRSGRRIQAQEENAQAAGWSKLKLKMRAHINSQLSPKQTVKSLVRPSNH